MKLLPRICLVFIMIVFFSGSAVAGDEPATATSSRPIFSESAFITGFGSDSIDEGDYQTILLIWHLGINMDRVFPSLKNHKGELTFFLEPQINPVVNPDEDFEFGVGLGLQFRYPLSERLSVYVLGSVGPHYISVVTNDQANGFLFADTVGTGVYFDLNKRSAINIGYRFRHMSNCDIEEPNSGINSHFGVIGYSVFF